MKAGRRSGSPCHHTSCMNLLPAHQCGLSRVRPPARVKLAQRAMVALPPAAEISCRPRRSHRPWIWAFARRRKLGGGTSACRFGKFAAPIEDLGQSSRLISKMAGLFPQKDHGRHWGRLWRRQSDRPSREPYMLRIFMYRDRIISVFRVGYQTVTRQRA